MYWYFEVLKKYAVFDGRARRSEYWMFYLFHCIIALLLIFIEYFTGIAPETHQFVLVNIYSLAVLIPNFAVYVRRLHDTDHSGWWLLIALIPLIGGIVLFVFTVQDSQPGENRYGPNPKGVLGINSNKHETKTQTGHFDEDRSWSDQFK